MNILENLPEFFSSDIMRWIVYGVMIYIGILWIALVAWVARDSVSRSRSLLFQTFMILFNMLLPVFGLLVYLLLRPPQTLMERYYDEVEHALLVDAMEKAQEEEQEKKIHAEKKHHKHSKDHK